MTQRGRAGAAGTGSRRPTAPRRSPAGESSTPAAPRIDLAAARTRVLSVIDPVVSAAGYDLEELSLSRAGRRHVLRVMVDADGGVNLDDVAVVSRAISDAMDAVEADGDEVLAGEYQLEVGSPGVDRPLTLPRHWRRNVTRLVAVAVDEKSLTGRVTAADDAGVVLDIDGTAHELTYAQLGPGRVQIEFNRVEEAEFDDSADDDEDDEDDEDGEGEDT